MASRSGFFSVVAKELKRVFTDRRMVLTVVLLPGILIFVMYSIMGEALGRLYQVDEDYRAQAYAVNLPASFEALSEPAGLAFSEAGAGEVAGIKADIAEGSSDLLVVFPADFEASISAALSGSPGGPGGPGSPGGTIPDVQVFFNAGNIESYAAFEITAALLDAYKNAALPLFSVNAADEEFNLAAGSDNPATMYLSSVLPMLILLLLFSGGMGIATESIAGEKERGTIATLLVTPLKRWELAFGKIVSISVVALASGTSSFLGIMLSLPKLLTTEMMGVSGEGLSFGYGFGEYALLFVVIVATVLLFVGVISIVSAFAKTVKEASTLTMPLMILVIFVSLSGLIFPGGQSDWWVYLIPAYNSTQCLNGIFSFNIESWQVLITVCVNVLATGLCVFFLTRMFNNERIMFAR
ncbi:MAG: ABC transporter permease [Eggerthellaceae bacterium]|nr:ABC transporter permease [Eggerthellaceae bacterium]